MFLNKHGSFVVGNPDIIVFGDISGSVSGSVPYFNKCREIYNELLIDNPTKNIWFFVWGSRTTRMTSDEFSFWINSRRGDEGTEPNCIVPEIPANFTGKLIIITDGEISDISARRCVESMANKFPIGEHQFKQVDVYLIQTGGFSPINLSVVTAFQKYGLVNTHEYPRNGVPSINTENSSSIIDSLLKIQHLEDITLDLSEQIRRLVMGVSPTILNRSFFVKIKVELMRLIRQFTPKSSSVNIERYNEIASMPEIDYEMLIQAVREINDEFYGKKTTEFSNQIKILHQCLSYLNNGISDFSKTSSIRTDANGNLIGLTVDLSKVIESPEIDEANIDPALLVEDAITCDQTLAEVLIKKPDVPFIPVDSSNLTDLIKFPLKSKLPGIQDLLLPSIGSAGTRMMAEAAGGNTFIHPTANVEVYSKGFIICPIGADNDLIRKIVQSNDAATIRLMFGTNKKLGNPCLFSLNFLLELLKSESEFISMYFDSILFEVKWRMQNCIVNATICGPSTEFVNDRMPLKDAILFTLLSAVTTTTSARNPYLQHHLYYDKLISLLAACGIELPEDVIFHFDMINFLMKMVHINKGVQGKQRNELLHLFNSIGKCCIVKEDCGDIVPTADIYDIEQLNVHELHNLEQSREVFDHISMIHAKLKELFKFRVQISFFSSLFNLLVSDGNLLKVPHVPFGFDHTNSIISKFDKYDLNSFDFSKLLCEMLSSLNKENLQDPSSQTINLPNINDVCIISFERDPKRLISRKELSDFFRTQLDTPDKIRAYIDANKVPVYSKSQNQDLLSKFRQYLINQGLIDGWTCIGRPKGRTRMSHRKWRSWSSRFSHWKCIGCPSS